MYTQHEEINALGRLIAEQVRHEEQMKLDAKVHRLLLWITTSGFLLSVVL